MHIISIIKAYQNVHEELWECYVCMSDLAYASIQRLALASSVYAYDLAAPLDCLS